MAKLESFDSSSTARAKDIALMVGSANPQTIAAFD